MSMPPRYEFQDVIDDFRQEFVASEQAIVEKVIESADLAANGKFLSSAVNAVKGTITSILKGKQVKIDLVDHLEKREDKSYEVKASLIQQRLKLLADFRDKSAADYQRFITRHAKMSFHQTFERQANDYINEPIYSPTRIEDNSPLTQAKKAHQLLMAALDELQQVINKQTVNLKDQIACVKADKTYALVRDLFALFLIRQPGTARINKFSDLVRLWTKKDHAERANDIAIELNNSQSIKRNNFSGNDLDIRALTAKLKRVSTVDMDSQSEAYVESKYRLVKAIHLLARAEDEPLKKAVNITMKEKISFYADLLFNEVDRDAQLAHTEDLLDDRVAVCSQFCTNHGTTVSRYGDDVEKDIRDRLQRLLRNIEFSNRSDYLNPERSASYLTNLINMVLSFYYTTYVEKLESFAKEALQADLDDPATCQTIHDRAMKMMNRELSDKTPCNYYHSPLAGIVLFLASYDCGARIVVEYDKHEEKLHIDYLGEHLVLLQDVNNKKSGMQSIERLTALSVANSTTTRSHVPTPMMH